MQDMLPPLPCCKPEHFLYFFASEKKSASERITSSIFLNWRRMRVSPIRLKRYNKKQNDKEYLLTRVSLIQLTNGKKTMQWGVSCYESLTITMPSSSPSMVAKRGRPCLITSSTYVGHISSSGCSWSEKELKGGNLFSFLSNSYHSKTTYVCTKVSIGQAVHNQIKGVFL